MRRWHPRALRRIIRASSSSRNLLIRAFQAVCGGGSREIRNMQRLILFGATSAIGAETARILAARGAEFFLVARDREKLSAVADDLRARGAKKVATAQ